MKTNNLTGKRFHASFILAIAMMMFSQSASAKLDYTPLRGGSSYDGCGFERLFDDNVLTKWCAADTHEGYDNGWWVIFKTSKAICPTSYTIVTGDDTKNNYERNWKTWKIYGANFDSSAAAQKDAAGWVLLDDKKDIGQDVIPADNLIEVTLDMSEINTDEYQYFMIYITEAGGADRTGVEKHQMSEFAFVESGDEPQEVTYTALDGSKSGWGAQFSYPSLVDGDATSKWCSNQTHEGYDNGWWIVFKSSAPIQPDYYTMITGDDTGRFPKNKLRNWMSWKIYAANFASDEEAVKNSEGWVLIDEQNNVGPELLPQENFAKVNFGLETIPSTAYSYFKIEVTETVGGDTHQMSEFAFGTSADEYEEVGIGTPEYASLFIPEKDLRIPEGVQAFTGKVNGSSLILTELTGWIPAGTAAILKATAGKYQFKVTKCSPAVGENDLKGTAEAIAADGTQYVLAEKNGVVGFYKAEGTIPAGKAYIEYTGAAGVKGFVLDDATGIEEIHNAQCIMHNNNAIFDLSGRRVEKATKGIYLINGKKLMK